MKAKRLSFLLVSVVMQVAAAQSNINAVNQFGWCENVGWTNWGDTKLGVNVGSAIITGHAWGENVGWINLGSGVPQSSCGGQPCYANLDGADFGVNADVDGSLFGLAWGENIGWINFDTATLGDGRARFDFCERRFFGFVWGENVGWLNLEDASTFVGVGPCDFADFDCDGEVAGNDYVMFPPLFGGPDVAVDCPVFDQDSDGDVDLLDFAAIQTVLTG